MLVLMTASRKCAAQTIPTDTTVLKYLYKEAATAYYLRIDTALLKSEIAIKDSLLLTKDSLITNRNEAFRVSQFENKITNERLQSCKKETETLNKEVKKLRFIARLIAVIGTISTTYFIVK